MDIRTTHAFEEAILANTAVTGLATCGEGVVYVQNGATKVTRWVPVGAEVDEWPADFREMLSRSLLQDQAQNFLVVVQQPEGLQVIAFPREEVRAAFQAYRNDALPEPP